MWRTSFSGCSPSRANSLKVGSGFDPETEMGPLIREQHRERVKGYIAKGEAGRREAPL